jgi:DNA-directed RNA polymerase subunit RPC12/RpoP
MHVCDAGPCCDEADLVRFRCARCGHESEWIEMGVAAAKRGVPCPVCDRGQD